MALGKLFRRFWENTPSHGTLDMHAQPQGISSATVINLLKGWPSTSLLPVEQIKDAVNTALSEPSVAHQGLLYGPDPGHEPCRQAIAEWLTTFYQPSTAIGAERICITGGASQNLGAMLSVYTDPQYTRNVWIVAPAYMLAFRIFDDAGLHEKLRAVPEDDHGIDLDFLSRAIQRSEEDAKQAGNNRPEFKPSRPWGKIYKHVIYCVPSFSNPSSRTMSLDRRRDLVRLARQYDALVIPDDVYDFLQWPAKPSHHEEAMAMTSAHLPRLVDIDRVLDGGVERPGADGFGNACSNGSFSKIAGPGIRVGWAEGSEKFAYGVSQTGTSKSGGAPSQLTSTYVTQLLRTGQLQGHIQDVLRPAYAERYRTMIRAIQKDLVPLGFRLPQPNRDVVGGFFIWLSLPTDLEAQDLTDLCLGAENLIIAPGKAFQVPNDDSLLFASSIRLCFAWEDVAKLEEGVKRIARAANMLIDKQKTTQEEYIVVGEDDIDRGSK